MKVLSSLLLAATLILTGCATIAQKPEVFNVQTLALVSVYVNNSIVDVDQGSNDSAPQGRNHAALQALASTAVSSLETALAVAGDWTVVPTASLVNKPAFLAMSKAVDEGLANGNQPRWGFSMREDTSVTAANQPRLPVVPLSVLSAAEASFTVTSSGDHVESFGKDDVLKTWGQLAQALGVDAVAIVQIDLGYQRYAFSGVRLLEGLSSADTNVAVAIAAVTTSGKLALDSGLMQAGGGDRVAGPTAPILRSDGTVDLTDPNAEGFEAYRQAIDKAVKNLGERINGELRAN